MRKLKRKIQWTLCPYFSLWPNDICGRNNAICLSNSIFFPPWAHRVYLQASPLLVGGPWTKFWPMQYEKFGNEIYCFYVWSLRVHLCVSLFFVFLILLAMCNGFTQDLQDLGIGEPVDERSLILWVILWSRGLTAFLNQLWSQQEIDLYNLLNHWNLALVSYSIYSTLCIWTVVEYFVSTWVEVKLSHLLSASALCLLWYYFQQNNLKRLVSSVLAHRQQPCSSL